MATSINVLLKVLFIWTIMQALDLTVSQSQDATIVLSQGTLIGLKVFPETSRIPIYTYLGIPYAKPPINELRFAPPVPSPGWNRTLYARDFKPICPQIENSSYEDLGSENQFRSRETSEDCLYLNIWIPETAIRYGGFPVLVMITGEEMGFDWNANRASGLDLAADGIIVVTVQYRTNVFGWLTLGQKYAPGNLGLLDQQLALVWIRDNIQKFGGDTNRLTLLGHGTTGGPNVMTHMVSPRARGLFARAIIMSGTIFSPYSEINADSKLSQEIVRILACNYDIGRNVLKCLQQKSIHDLLRAYEYIYRNGNYTVNLGPIIDSYQAPANRYIIDDPRKLFQAKALFMEDMPILFGITSNEGGFMYSKWIELARQSIDSLKKYINDTLLPNIIERYDFQGIGQDQIRETIYWRYFDQIPQTTAHHIHAIIKVISETRYEIPFYRTLQALSSRKKSTGPESTTSVESLLASADDNAEKRSNVSRLYVYLFHHPNSMDMRGKINFFGGASHSSDLPFLMGPSLYREIGRRRLSAVEDKLCKKMRSLFSEFIKGGNPTPGRQFDSWKPYSDELKHIKLISAKPESFHRNDHTSLENTFEDNLQEIEEKLIGSIDVQEMSSDANTSKNPYNLNPNIQADQENARTSKNAVFLASARDSEYFYYLRKMDSFWDQFLPKLSQIMNETNQEKLRNRRIDLTLEEEQDLFRETAAASKYKHAFFSMLTLVCMLLAVLCILFDRKNRRKKPDVSSMGDEDEINVTAISHHRIKTAERVIRTNPLYGDNFRKLSESLSSGTGDSSGVSASNRNVLGTHRSPHTMRMERPVAILTDLDEDLEVSNWRYQLSASHFSPNTNSRRQRQQQQL
ncbi:acetylcholinesterase [Anopheles stephensi]|uniref:acetylcholinesterase n=1 Tax=Anopheles stephensi TaxID=30069 RepID=UPI0016588856|nr:acetylcholinesterase [Anopheles stephensi]